MAEGQQQIDIARALEACRKPLLDTGGRSRLINFRLHGRKTKRWMRVLGENPDQVFNRLVGRSQHFLFDPLPDEMTEADSIRTAGDSLNAGNGQSDGRLQADRHSAALDACLETIARHARSIIDETGVNMLYLAIGMLEWYQSDSSQDALYSPLILIPVELKKEFSEQRRKYIYPLRHNGQELQSNLSLAKRLEEDFGLRLPPLDDEQIPTDYFAAIQRDVLIHQPRWKVLDDAVLAFFSFQKQLLYLDLDPKNWSNGDGRIDNLQIRKIFEGVDRGEQIAARHDDISIDVDPVAQRTMMVVDADSSQHSALCDIAEGHDLVIEGPPGTGKSQTIINAIASAIASGKTVLFVAEKLAALKVVYDRLDGLGLADLCLNLHSDQATPRLVFEDLGRRLQSRFHSPGELEATRNDLARKRQALHDYLEATRETVGPLELPLRDVFWRVARLRGEGAPLLRHEVDADMSRDRFNDSATVLTALSKHVIEIGTLRECPWWGFECSRLPQADIPSLRAHLERLLEAAGALSQESDTLDELVELKVDWFADLHGLDATQLILLEALPADVDAMLCRRLADSDRRDTGRELLQSLHEFKSAAAVATAACVSDWSEHIQPAKDFTATFRNRFAKLSRRDVTPADLAGWRSRLAQSIELLGRIVTLSQSLHEIGFDRADTLAQARSIIDLYRLITDEAVLGSDLIHANLLLASTEREFLRARDEQRTLQARYDQLSGSFAMSDLPANESLSALRRTLRPYINCWHRVLWGEYRRARNELMRFSAAGAKRSVAQWVKHLEDLEAWRTDAESFGEDPRLRGGLGAAFLGWETQWDQLEHLVRWGKTLASRGIAGRRAIELVAACAKYSERPHLSDLQGVMRQLEDELAELPPEVFIERNGVGVWHMRFDALHSLLCAWQDDIDKILVSSERFRRETDTTLEQLDKAAGCVVWADELKRKIEGSDHYGRAFPEFFAGMKTSIATLEAAVNLLEHLAPLGLPTPVLDWLFEAAPCERALRLRDHLRAWISRRDDWLSGIAEMRRFGAFNDGWLGEWSGEPARHPTARIGQLRSSIDILPAWINFCRYRERCADIGLTTWVEAVADGVVQPDQLVSSFDLTVHDAAARRATEQSPHLRHFSRQEHEQIRAEFASLDRELIRLHREQVRWQAGNRQPPAGVSTGRVGTYTQMGLIQHEVTKQRRHCSLRDLVRRAGGALGALKPCWMMSPLSVAQYIEPGAFVFDLLIMDEASQIKPEDALGSVARAEQVIVVGDPKQMPPSSWMERSNDGLDSEDDDAEQNLSEDNESILEWGMGAYRRIRRLKWHYRSQHESLIAFSNEKFYDRELVIFPAPGTQNARLGVRFDYVPDGRWADRKNVAEAQQVAQAIVRHAHEQLGKPPDEVATLGVATFNAPQMELIQEELDRLLSGDEAARHAVDQLRGLHEDLFIKNVENLQGDERDVIFISYTYGPDTTGRVAQGFFPINTEKGWRRFNVMVTRARQRIEVVSSLLPEQITGGSKRPFGVQCMRDYLIYARDGTLVDAGTPTGRQPDSDFEIAVANAVQRMGYEVHAQVGVAGYFIDLAVLVSGGDGDYLLGIECDGAAYHSAKSARDRDRLRQEVIERRGWSIHRIWSTDWFRNQSSEEIRLAKVIEAAITRRGLSDQV